MRKILPLLFSIAFLLIFVSFFSQKTLATNAECQAAGGSCIDRCNLSTTLTKAVGVKCDTIYQQCCKAPVAPSCSSLATAMNFTASCLTLDKCDTSYAYWNASATSDCTGQQFCCNAAPATLACTSPNACSTSCSTHGVGGSCPSAAQTCCAPATTTTDKGTIPNGAHGCSFKISANVSSTTITIPPEDMLVSCQNKGICTPDNQSSAQIVNGGPEIINGLCLSTDNQCPVCYSGYQYTNQGDCVSIADYTKRKPLTRTDSCTDTQGCDPGIGCLTAGTGVLTSQALSLCNNGVSCPTALGDLPTHLPDLLTKVFSIVLSIAGVVALSLIIASGYKLMVSQGNPEQVKGAREQLTAAIIGLLFIIFSLVILQIIGGNILNIPGFT